MFCDAHFHLIPSVQQAETAAAAKLFPFKNYSACTCAHSREEYEESFIKQKQMLSENLPSVKIFNSFGIHPQQPLIQNADFLEKLLQNNELDAIGEAGFDYFTEEFRQTAEAQKKCFEIQLELAQKYSKPLVIHSRKSMEQIFSYSKELKKLPAVLFHSFPDNPPAALSLLKHGINGYFSFGKQILNGNKKAISCVLNLPVNTLLLETDAPFQTLKNEAFTLPSEIERVYKAAFSLKTGCKADILEENTDYIDFCNELEINFYKLFGK